MPIHLPPLSRRRFLANAVLASAAALLPRPLLAARKSVDENSWALFSDTHIAADAGKITRGVNMTENLKAVCTEALALPRYPAGMLLNGDCALDRGEAGDYAQLTALLRPLREAGLPLHLALGNHDEREHFWAALPEKERAANRPVPDHHVAIIETPRANWFVLDSLDKTLVTPGIIGAAQLEWLARSLDAHPRKPALVFTHHNPSQIADPKMALRDTAEFMAVIRPRKQVKAHFFGHTHHWEIQRDESGIHLVNLPPVAYVFQEGQPSGWVHATLQRQGMRLELRCLDRKHAAHGHMADLKWRA
jgi:Icc protein